MLDFRKENKMEACNYYGKTIAFAGLNSEKLLIEFTDRTSIEIYDDGQCCCENRFITCDDDIESLYGTTLISIEKGISKEVEDEEVHEIAFVHIKTNLCTVTLCTHNIHNGYYGGFDLTIKETTRKEL